MTLYPNIYGVIPSPATVMVLMGRGAVLEICTHGIPVVNPTYFPCSVDNIPVDSLLSAANLEDVARCSEDYPPADDLSDPSGY